MTKRRHLARRAAESLIGSIAQYPLWMLDVQHAGAYRSKVTEEHIRTAIGIPGSQPGSPLVVNGSAVIPIVGMIVTRESWATERGYATSQQAVQRQYEAAIGNSEVRGIAFYVDTPGGMAQGNEEAARAMHAMKGRKPTVAYVEGMMCSAGYYLGSVADRIVASPSSLVGSIGSILVHFEVTKFLEAIGFTATVIRNPAKKALGGMFEPLGEAGRASWQSKIDELTAMFESAVARHRVLSRDTVRANYGQGEAFFAEAALQRGLIDQVGSFADALNSLSGGERSRPTQVVPVLGNSEIAAGGSSLPPSSPESRVPSPSLESRTMDPRLKAALFAKGLISSMEASDAECQAALRSFYMGLGKNVPKNGDAIDIDQALAGLWATAPTLNPQHAAGPQQPAGAPNNVQKAREQEIAEAAIAQHKLRSKELRQRGQILGVSEEKINAAIESNVPTADVVMGWMDERAKTETPITPVAGGHGGENFEADVMTAAALQCNIPVASNPRPREVAQLRRASLSQIAAQCLRMNGVRISEYASREEILEEAIAMDGTTKKLDFGQDSPAFNRPGNFPNLLSGVANMAIDRGFELANVSYPEWTGEWPEELDDFTPAAVTALSEATELQQVQDEEDSKDLDLKEELMAAIQVDRYSNKIKFSPLLKANDKFGVFVEKNINMGGAGERKVNRNCLRVLTGNQVMLDEFQFFDDTNHGNDILVGSGGEPSDSQWDAMQLKVFAQMGINQETYITTPLGVLLCPPKLWRPAVQSLGSFRSMDEKIAATDATRNVYRGLMTIVREPELQAVSNKVWYGFCDPTTAPAVVRAYQKGWGRKGRRQRWYRPENKCLYFELEIRFGVAPRNWRYGYRNAGE